MATTTVPAPTTDPAGRDPATVANPAGYRRDCRIWIYRGDAWRPGLVLASSARAATVRYRHTAGRATSVDTAIPVDLALRDEFDPGLDRPSARTGAGAPGLTAPPPGDQP